MRFKCIYTVIFISEFCFIGNEPEISHTFYEVKEFLLFARRKRIEKIKRLAFAVFGKIPLYGEFAPFISNILFHTYYCNSVLV